MRRRFPQFQSVTSCAVAFAIVLCAGVAVACNVPVFRYALEHWRPDPYRGTVFHRGPLSPEHVKQLARFQEEETEQVINLAVRTVDLDATPSAEDAELAATLKDAPLPQLVVQYPPRLLVETPVWTGAVEESSLSSLVDSPARQEVIKRLINGETAVWVMIESADSAQNDAAALVLDEELETLKTTLKLPVQTDAPEDQIQDGPELRVAFSVVRIPRNDPAEQALIGILLNSEPDLASLEEPLVFPVFGRCRSLLPLVGAGINAENIRGSARFLAGACSCQVKEQNPGFDLLLTADWTKLIPWAKSPAYASGELAAATSTTPELLPIASGAPATPPAMRETTTVAQVDSVAATAVNAPAAVPPEAPPEREVEQPADDQPEANATSEAPRKEKKSAGVLIALMAVFTALIAAFVGMGAVFRGGRS